jgi:hypothetical protein
METTNEGRRWQWSLIVALAVWGLYLSIGATGIVSRQANPFDIRRPAIVMTCSAGFLLLWLASLRNRGKRESASENAERLNPANVVSLSSAVAAYLSWSLATWGERGSVRMGLLSMLCFGISGVSALVGLSDPQPRRGKWMSSAGLLLVMLGVATFLVKMWIYAHRSA